MNLPMIADPLRAIDRRTEGSIVGVQDAALIRKTAFLRDSLDRFLSLRGLHDAKSAGQCSVFGARFSIGGDASHILHTTGYWAIATQRRRDRGMSRRETTHEAM